MTFSLSRSILKLLSFISAVVCGCILVQKAARTVYFGPDPPGPDHNATKICLLVGRTP